MSIIHVSHTMAVRQDKKSGVQFLVCTECGFCNDHYKEVLEKSCRTKKE